MFDSITIHYIPKQHSIGKLAECLLFYDEVNIILRPNSLAHLLQNIGINELDDLRAFGLKIYIATDYFAAMPIGSGTRIMLLQTPHTDMHYRMIEMAMKEYFQTDVIAGKVRRRIIRYKDITQAFNFPKEALAELTNSTLYCNFYKKVLYKEFDELGIEELYLSNSIDYTFENSNNCYLLKSNLNINELNALAKRKGLEYEFNFSQQGFLLSLVSAFSDMIIAANKNSDLLTSTSCSLILSQKLSDIIQKTNKNLNSVSAFQRIILPESKDIETIINSKEKPFYDFIKLLEKAQEFKKWKKEIPEEKNFIEEYTKAISKNSTWIERLPIKIMRFIIFESLGATLDMLGSNGLASLGLSSFDSFIIDKLIKRWKPNQFISNNLRKFLC